MSISGDAKCITVRATERNPFHTTSNTLFILGDVNFFDMVECMRDRIMRIISQDETNNVILVLERPTPVGKQFVFKTYQ
jgi:hypothetical protein